jgi:hypothetical protein
MWRRNIDGTEFVVHDKSEAYAEPEKIAGFLPNKPIPEQTETTTEPEAEDGLQEEERIEEEVTAAPAKRGPGRPKKVVA